MADEMFNEDERQESEYLEQAEAEQSPAQKPKKKLVKTYFNPVAFKEDIAINPVDINNAFFSQAALFAHYSTQHAKANEQVENIKLRLDVEEARLFAEHRNNQLAGGEKATEKVIMAAVTTDPRYIRLRKAYNEARAIAEMLKGASGAFVHRRDMLVQIGAANREELKGEIRIKQIEAKEDRAERSLRRASMS